MTVIYIMITTCNHRNCGWEGPWIDSTFDVEDAKLAYRLYKSSLPVKAKQHGWMFGDLNVVKMI